MARLFPKPVISPDLQGREVTFRIKAEKATMVQLDGEMLEQPLAMTKDSEGVWSVTLSGLDEDVFCYNFIVDGMPVADPQNMYLAPDRGFKRSILNLTKHVASPTAEISIVRYQTTSYADGTFSSTALVIPPHHGEDLPTIALIAGENDTFESWYKIGKANEILDQMIAEKQCKPCILVLSETPVPIATKSLNSADYKSWKDARAALVTLLKQM